MTVQITIDVPNRLGQQLQPFKDRLPEVLERGLRDLLFERTDEFPDEQSIIVLLASQPTPEQVMSIHPSAKLQARVSDLLARSKVGVLQHAEEIELERYLILEHLARLAKAQAYRQLNPHS